MKLEDYKQDYYWYSGKASDVARQLAFAGIALVWIFKSTSQSGVVLPKCLLWPMLFLGIGLAADLLQYITGTIVWGCFHHHHEQKEPDDPKHNPDLYAPIGLSIPISVFFVIKLCTVVIGYSLLIKYLLSELLQFC